MELIQIDSEELFIFLSERESSISEYELIKKFTPPLKEDSFPYSLYERHFSIFHALYSLKIKVAPKGLFLYIDPLRIRLLPIPEKGFCQFYNPEEGSFCYKETPSFFCSEHEVMSPLCPSFDPMFEFYLDPENINFGESEILQNTQKGLNFYLLHKKEVDRALDLFAISKPTRKKIAARYRELAFKFHPDKDSGNEEMMKQINSAYSILQQVYVF
ncbi:MAG: Chaperone protein DnaJ [Spirochaetes bacterium ADurb.Bin218]|jgi:hypothetical protein|nr:MAG: Chaperone protein DnaJ [Spirochaetes bacterium ADurb.Bin218]HOQ11569.1 DNA-J related domain-containing protein [Spirochaetota bacterium]HOV07710.1 DNA-J related domain-containing protein [Spirochaetota bacterium]HPX91981.1 DNA-J related domain-containing protein [Spirochaetota bacterium]HRU66073.1 DNA-J related domain-containing protein [Spirochaetota bacterium]